MREENEARLFEKFCRRNGLPFDLIGTVDMTESLNRWLDPNRPLDVRDFGAVPDAVVKS